MAYYKRAPGAENRRQVTVSVLKISVFLLLGAIVQTSFFGFFRIFGTVPNVTLVLVLLFSFFMGETCGAISGILGGFFVEALGSFGISLLPLFYMVFGYLVGNYAKTRGGGFLHFLICLGWSAACQATVTLVYAGMTYENLYFLKLLFFTVVPEVFSTAGVGLLLYLPLRALCSRMEGRRID